MRAEAQSSNGRCRRRRRRCRVVVLRGGGGGGARRRFAIGTNDSDSCLTTTLMTAAGVEGNGGTFARQKSHIMVLETTRKFRQMQQL